MAYNRVKGSTALNASEPTTRPRVLVTRPAHQAERFCQLLLEANFEPVRCPTVDIAAVEDVELAKSQLAYIAEADVVIFTSANAVHYANQITPLKQLIAQHLSVLAIGLATTASLEQYGLSAEHPKSDFSSLGLLALPTLNNIANKQVVLVRGMGGLETLPNALRLAGAKLQLAEVYQRQLAANASLMKRLFHTELPQIISTTSNESLSNLVTLIPKDEHPRLWRIPIIVNSARGEHLAQSLGFCDDILRASPVGDHGQISTLKAWITQRLTQR